MVRNYVASIINSLYFGSTLRKIPVKLEFEDWIFVTASYGKVMM